MEQNLADFLSELSKKLGTTVEDMYKVLVKQARVDAIVAIIKCILLIPALIGVYIAWVHLIPYCKPEVPPPYAGDTDWPPAIIGCFSVLVVITTLSIIFTVVQIDDTIDAATTGFINPEASALNKIMSVIKK